MTVKDNLLLLRTAKSVAATEAGWITKTRDDTTGQIVVQIDKCPLGGIPVEVIAAADSDTSNDKTMVVTIEASDTLGSSYIVVATFPTITYADTTAVRLVRNIATQKKYLRSVITVSGSNGTISRLFEIAVGIGQVDDDAGF